MASFGDLNNSNPSTGKKKPLGHAYLQPLVGRDSVHDVVTRYGLDGPGIESRWESRFSAPVQTGPVPHSQSCTVGTGSPFRG